MNIENQKSAEQMDLLTAVEHIVELASGSALCDEFYSEAEPYINYLSNRLDLTREQSVLLALFIDNSDDLCISLSDLCRILDCRTTRILKRMNDIDVLENRELIRRNGTKHDERHISYEVPYEVIDAFKRNEKFVPRDLSGLTCAQLFDELDVIFNARKDGILTFDATCQKIYNLLDNNPQLVFVTKIQSYGFNNDSLMLLALFSHLFVNNGDDNIAFHDIDFLFERIRWNNIKSMLNRGTHPLILSKMIEWNNNDGFVTRDSFRITSQAKRDLFGELDLVLLDSKKKRNDVIKAEDIVAKKLYYSENINLRIDELAHLLDDSQYLKIRSRMEESGFRCGFACLFYGAPGTGKTETVLQLARQTGRDVMQVNIAQMKSMWVGESEKNVKRVFDEYRAKVKNSDIAPILLFNEADAIIGQRMENAERSVDKMNNTMQNILLQEMETLDGIMIATTNLAQNLDKAFERRFLYKIKFDKPTPEARMSIWQEMIPDLTVDEARTLSSRYEFSGGQIENIARRHAISKILHGDNKNILVELLDYCDDEKLETSQHKKIGF